MYTPLRHFILSEDLQRELPGWPYPLLFQGEEISRDIFFLDPLVELRILKLGRNPVRDVDYLRYASLNRWFHYRFFFCLNACGRTGESATLKPRLLRLQRCLMEGEWSGCLDEFLSRDLEVPDPSRLLTHLRGEIARMLEICDQHELIVWGQRLDNICPDQQRAFRESIAHIRVREILALPHLQSLKSEWDEALKKEVKAYRKAEAEINKQRKMRARQPR